MKLLMWVMAVVAIMSLACIATAGDPPAPLAVSIRSIGGGALNQYTPGVDRGVGLNNIGLLIRTWGKVTYVDTTNKFFYIDDGSGRLDGTKRADNSYIPGVRVSYDNLAPGNTITPPSAIAYVLVTGISSTVVVGGKVQPNLRPRKDTDIQPIQ